MSAFDEIPGKLKDALTAANKAASMPRPTIIFWDGKGRHPLDQSEPTDKYGINPHGTYDDLGA